MAKSIKILFVLSIPVILWGLLLILPTFDDWTYLTAPYFGDFFDNKGLLPQKSYWRPFDATMGYILGMNYKMFPALNHIIIFAGHIISTILIYLLSKKNIFAAAFYYLSTATLGTVMDIDSANQVYSQLWGLLALWFYQKDKKWLWIACFIIATFAKENGIMFAVIPILLKWGTEKTLAVSKPYIKDGLMAFAAVAVYGIARIILTPADNVQNAQYMNNSMLDHAKDLVQYTTTWIPIDMAAIAYQPTRCLPLAIFTLLLALPFIYLICTKLYQHRKDKMMYALILSFFLAGAPHLVTLVSVMHSYAGLGMLSLLLAFLFPVDSMKEREIAKKKEIAMFLAFMSASLISDIHHWHEAYKSGLVGKELAMDILSKTEGAPQNIQIINIDNEEPRYSIFNVIPRETLGWGKAVRFESGYTVGTEELSDTVIGPFENQLEKELGIEKMRKETIEKNRFEAIWLIDGVDVKVEALK